MGQGRAVDEALRQRMSSELRALEASLHSSLMALSATGGGSSSRGEVEGSAPGGGQGTSASGRGAVASGDAAFVEVELALRAVQNGALELAAIIPNR